MSRTARLLSLVLRHAPERIGLTLGADGWVPTRDLLAALRRHGHRTTPDELADIVSADDKGRFTLSDDGRRIRAAQGHSVEVELGLQPLEPPEVLYHGTASRSLDAIFEQGLRPMSRRQVHLSIDAKTATKVGGRHGRPVVLEVAAGVLHRNGSLFYRADNGVWLVDAVPPGALTFAPPETDVPISGAPFP